MSVGVIGHHQCLTHEMGEHHPEAPAAHGGYSRPAHSQWLGLRDCVNLMRTAIDKELLYLAHDKDYIAVYLCQRAKRRYYISVDDDTIMNPNTLNAALLSAGAAKDAVDLVMSKELSSAFCATRPPGHHAELDKGMGFCFFNNVAIAALHMRKKKYKLKRVAIVDFDVHHGNGTEDIVKNKKGFLFCSTYQYPHFTPLKFKASTKPPIINTPLDASAKSADFRHAILDHLAACITQI